MKVEKFSEKSLWALGECYVYGLIDPRTNQIFYIGKGKGNRVFAHEKESLGCPESEKFKLKTIAEIHAEGQEVKKIIINWNLTEAEAFAAEAALINAFNFVNNAGLTNEVSGRNSAEAFDVETFEQVFGAEELREINHRVMVIKVNRFYRRNMSPKEVYDVVRGIWRADINRARGVDYVFGVFNSLIVAVFKPSEWFVAKDAIEKLPKNIILNPENENRIFFVDENFENPDEMAKNYLWKSIAEFDKNQGAQNPITYINA